MIAIECTAILGPGFGLLQETMRREGGQPSFVLLKGFRTSLTDLAVRSSAGPEIE